VNNELQNEEKLLRIWRKKGPIGKLHNIATYITRSPRRRVAFKDLQATSPKMIVRDNDTRWNSVFLMLQSAIKLKSTIDQFTFSEPDLSNDRLNHEDWNMLRQIYEFLEPFYHATQRLQSNTCLLTDLLTTMDFLLGKYEKAKQVYKDGPLATSVNMGWLKLDKWYKATERSPVYVAAVVLDPRLKWEYFEESAEWDEGWVKTAKKNVAKLWMEYKGSVSGPPSISSHLNSSMDEYDQFRLGKRKRIGPRDEYTTYQQTPCDMTIKDVRAWWIGQKAHFPDLSLMALDVLAIPATSAEIERVFSSAGQLITDRRNRLKDATIEAVECVKSWRKQGIIKEPEIDKDVIPDNGDNLE